MGRSVLRWVRVFALCVVPLVGCGETPAEDILAGAECVGGESEPPLDWGFAIEAYESSDVGNPPERGQVVFTGSSSIWLWESLAEDMLPIPALNRGFGGSVTSQATQHADRIVLPYEPTAVVLFSGTNDLNLGGSADCVFRDYEGFVAKIHAASPDLPIYFVSLQPTPARWHVWEDMQRANQLIEALAQTGETLHFIDVAEAMLDEQGKPIEALFKHNQLHLKEVGYELWTSIVRPVLLRDLGY